MANTKNTSKVPKKPKPNGKPTKNARKKMANKMVQMKLPDGKVATMPKSEQVKLSRVAKQERCEEIVTLSSPNTIYSTSGDYPAGNDLNWQEVIESILASFVACQAPPVPVGPANFKAYLWWFMIDRLREVGGVYPEPNLSIVPTFPENGNIPSGWAKFVEYLMPYRDPDTGTCYQFRYNYTYATTPATTSAVINPSAPAGDFSFGALNSFFLVPNAPPTGNQEYTWTFVNNAFSFLNDTVANNGDISQWIAAAGEHCQAKHVPFTAPDAAAVAIPIAHNNSAGIQSGVYCMTKRFDPEMACILHPPIVTTAIVTASFFNLVPFDWCVKALPQIFNAGISKTFAAGSNLNTPGQLELILNYGYVTHNTRYAVGHRTQYLGKGNPLWPGLRSYRPYYYPWNDQAYQQMVSAIIAMISLGSDTSTPAAGDVAVGVLSDTGDYMTLLAYFESKKIARSMEHAYVGLILNTQDDVVSQTQFGSEFRNSINNPVLEDLLDTIAPTVREGRLVNFYFDYRPIGPYGFTYNANLVGINVNAQRWIRIGDDFASAAGNINDFQPQVAGVYTGYCNGVWVFSQQQVGNGNWPIRGPGQNVGAPNWSIAINSANLGVTIPLPATYALGNVIGPCAPCQYATRFATKAAELMGPTGAGTWQAFEYAKLGGYCTQTQVSGVIAPNNMVQSTANGPGNYINLNFKFIAQKLGSYVLLDQESVGRSFSYSPRIALAPGTAITDRFPAEQNLGGNSPVQDALCMNTQVGPNSNFNRAVQAKLGDRLSPIQAVRAVLGPMHKDVIPNFAGDDMLLWKAFELILKFRKYVYTAPYHEEHSASITSYNSPNCFDQLLGGLFDVGERLVSTVGGVLGGVLGSPTGKALTTAASHVAANYFLGKFGTDFTPSVLEKKYQGMVIKVPDTPSKYALTSENIAEVKKSRRELRSMDIKHETEPVPTTDEIVNMAIVRLREQMLTPVSGVSNK